MPWVRLDDHFDEHRKVEPLSDGAFRAFVESLCVSNRNLHDGYFEQAAAHKRWPRRAIKELVSRGLWDVVEGGYQVHDYTQYQMSSDQILAERAAARQRMQELRGQRRRGRRSPEHPAEHQQEQAGEPTAKFDNSHSHSQGSKEPLDPERAHARDQQKPEVTEADRRALVEHEERVRAEAMRGK